MRQVLEANDKSSNKKSLSSIQKFYKKIDDKINDYNSNKEQKNPSSNYLGKGYNLKEFEDFEIDF